MTSTSRTVYVTDLDGTLLDDRARLSDRTRAGLVDLLDDGLLLTVASARSVVAMQSILRGLCLPLPIIEFNGAFISDLESGEHLVTNAMDADDARVAYELVRGSGCSPFVSTFDGSADRLYYSRIDNPGMEWYVSDRARNRDRRLRRTNDLSARLREEVVCLTVIDRSEVLAELALRLSEQLADRTVIRHFRNDYFPEWEWVTVVDHGATKDQAVVTLLDAQGLGDAAVVAFGDSDNDLPLFRMADRGIAVANASAELKSLASQVIGSSIEDSVVLFLEEELAGPTN